MIGGGGSTLTYLSVKTISLIFFCSAGADFGRQQKSHSTFFRPVPPQQQAETD